MKKFETFIKLFWNLLDVVSFRSFENLFKKKKTFSVFFLLYLSFFAMRKAIHLNCFYTQKLLLFRSLSIKRILFKTNTKQV